MSQSSMTKIHFFFIFIVFISIFSLNNKTNHIWHWHTSYLALFYLSLVDIIITLYVHQLVWLQVKTLKLISLKKILQKSIVSFQIRIVRLFIYLFCLVKLIFIIRPTSYLFVIFFFCYCYVAKTRQKERIFYLLDHSHKSFE